MPCIPQPPSLESKSLKLGKKDPMIPWEIIGVMVQMIEVRFGIRKTPFLGTINPEKWLIK
jgi:hypothetical protein